MRIEREGGDERGQTLILVKRGICCHLDDFYLET